MGWIFGGARGPLLRSTQPWETPGWKALNFTQGCRINHRKCCLVNPEIESLLKGINTTEAVSRVKPLPPHTGASRYETAKPPEGEGRLREF